MAMNDTKHTPTPWREFSDADGTDIMTLSGDHIATIEPGSTCEGNAALIVRAVNAHDELVAALRKIVDSAPGWEPQPEDYTDTEEAYSNGYDVGRWELSEIARAAIAGVQS